MIEERMEVIVMGRALGTASGWDQADNEAIFFYDFVPYSATGLKACETLLIDFPSGTWSGGNEITDLKEDLIPILARLQRKE